MKVEEPGHYYVLDSLDRETAQVERNDVRLYFVKRTGDRYPGNVGESMSGPLCQEVIRALIDRLLYLDSQIPNERTRAAVYHLRDSILQLEVRAAEERGDHVAAREIFHLMEPEREPVCVKCGHLMCKRHF